jgi:hypothetical protein
MSGEKGGLFSSLFWRAAASFALFYTNPILPGLSLLFARLFCLQHYLQEPGGAWLGVVARSEITEKEFWKPAGWERFKASYCRRRLKPGPSLQSIEDWTLRFGGWILLPFFYGWNSCQTAGANFARTRLGFFQ